MQPYEVSGRRCTQWLTAIKFKANERASAILRGKKRLLRLGMDAMDKHVIVQKNNFENLGSLKTSVVISESEKLVQVFKHCKKSRSTTLILNVCSFVSVCICQTHDTVRKKYLTMSKTLLEYNLHLLHLTLMCVRGYV